MSRRGLVSKSFGPSGGSPGGAALVPKGEGGPPSSGVMSIEEVASSLRVTTQQVSEWIRKDTLRANDAGVKPYDLKKFQYDSRDEIARAQAQALRESQRPIEKSHQKSGGFFSKLFGKGKAAAPTNDGTALAKENKRLRDELQRVQSEPQDDTATNRLEEKVRYLEEKLNRSAGLENENAALRRQLTAAEDNSGSPTDNSSELRHELEQVRSELAHSQEAARIGEELRHELSVIQDERARLEAEVARLLDRPDQPIDGNHLDDELARSQEAFRSLEERFEHQQSEENLRRTRLEADLAERERAVFALQNELEQLREAGISSSSTSESPNQTALIEELLALQETNLARFVRLKELKELAEQKLLKTSSGESVSTEGSFTKLQAEFETLRVKHQTLLEARENNDSGHQEFAEQLAAARVTATRLKQENTALKNRLSETDIEGWKQKIDDLQRRLRDATSSEQGTEQMELELRATRKSLQAREAQVQKIAGRVQENERALKKALKESTRLTELLIERENRLRDLSTEYEQEYRDKIDNLDRQVSGLQWKLSLREERIASLESEVNELRKQVGRE